MPSSAPRLGPGSDLASAPSVWLPPWAGRGPLIVPAPSRYRLARSVRAESSCHKAFRQGFGWFAASGPSAPIVPRDRKPFVARDPRGLQSCLSRAWSARRVLLKQRKAKIEKELAAIEARERAKVRKEETRLKVLIGGGIIADAKVHPEIIELIQEILARATTAERDRELLKAKDWLPKTGQ